MQRRIFVTAGGTALITALAGCSGSSEDDGDGGDGEGESTAQAQEENQENQEQQEEEESPEEAPQGEDVLEYKDLEILEHELVEEEFSTSIEGVAENHRDETVDYVEVRARVYNEEGHQLDSYFTNTTDLQAGGTWAFEVMILDSDAEVAEYDIQISDSPF